MRLQDSRIRCATDPHETTLRRRRVRRTLPNSAHLRASCQNSSVARLKAMRLRTQKPHFCFLFKSKRNTHKSNVFPRHGVFPLGKSEFEGKVTSSHFCRITPMWKLRERASTYDPEGGRMADKMRLRERGAVLKGVVLKERRGEKTAG